MPMDHHQESLKRPMVYMRSTTSVETLYMASVLESKEFTNDLNSPLCSIPRSKMLRSIKGDQRPIEILGRGRESWLENKEKEEATLAWASKIR